MTSDSLLRLAAEIEDELGDLKRVVEEGPELRPELEAEAPMFYYLRAAGSVLHDYYCGVESALRRVGQEINGGLPEGADWHRQLLTDMAIEIPELRPAVISRELKGDLDELRAFRHVFRNVYGFALKPERLRELTARLPGIHKRLSAELRAFAGLLRQILEQSP